MQTCLSQCFLVQGCSQQGCISYSYRCRIVKARAACCRTKDRAITLYVVSYCMLLLSTQALFRDKSSKWKFGKDEADTKSERKEPEKEKARSRYKSFGIWYGAMVCLTVCDGSHCREIEGLCEKFVWAHLVCNIILTAQ